MATIAIAEAMRAWCPNSKRWYETAPWRRYAARLHAFKNGYIIRPSEHVPYDEIWDSNI